MGIQPIDLQTLYTQLDKVGKSQIQQQQALQASRDSQIVLNKLKAEQKMKTVQEAEAGKEQAGIVHERNADPEQNTEGFPEKDGKEQNETVAPVPEKEIIRDPALGAHIDITG